MTTFFTADLHIGHKNIIKFEQAYRPFASIEEHNESIVDRWNAVVGVKDVVWVLGDVVFGADNFWYLDRLHGQKNLVLGNHDHFPKATYLKYFRKLEGCAKFDSCILSHVPVHPNQLEHRFKANIHGHMHSKVVTMDRGTFSKIDARYINVSVEQTGLAPISWDVLQKRIPKGN